MTRSTLAVLALLASTSPVFAQTVRLSVADAVTRGFENSHRLAEIKARQEAARAALTSAELAKLPTANAGASYMRTNHVPEFGFVQNGVFRVFFPDIPDNIVTRVSMQWPIYTAGRTDALEAAAQAEVDAVGADLETARADLRFEIVRAYWAGVTARETVRVLEESTGRAEAQLNDARQRLNVGLTAPNEVASFEAQRSREQAQLIEAKNIREATQVDLRRLLGLETGAVVELTDALSSGVQEFSGSAVPAVLKEALATRSERVSLTHRIHAADERVKAASTVNKPVIGVGAGFDYANPNPKIFPREGRWQTSWDVGVNVNWQFFDFGRTKAQMAEAAAQVTAARERLAELDTVIAADVQQRLLDLDSSRAMVQAASDAVKSAAEARRVVSDRYNAGVATSTDLLVAQVALLETQLSQTRALAGVRLAESRLERALGRQ